MVSITDCHVHMESEHADQEALFQKLDASRAGELVVLSLAPSCFKLWKERDYTNEERLDILLRWCEGANRLHPVYWIDPTEDDAEAQVERAVERGVQGFKVICGHHYPGDPRAMKAYRRMAKLGRSVMFHSGILWDAKPSSKYNRPAEFEDLIEIEGLKFALAHISWPWVDECVAVFGKYENARKFHGLPGAEMYIDITPGTPDIYREEALRRIFQVGYDVEDAVFFGSDQNIESYEPAVTEAFVDRDLELFQKLGISDSVPEKVFSANVKKFYGF